MSNRILATPQQGKVVRFDNNAIQILLNSDSFRICAFFAAHALLAASMAWARDIATAHALVTLGAGLWWAATGANSERVAYVVAYITGAEVLWRMTQAQVFWEFGKYSVVIILLVSVLRQGQLRGSALPLLYFALLLPSTVTPMANTSADDLRAHLSFNLSGPLALMVCVWYFSRARLSAASIKNILLILVAPIIGVGTVAILSTVTSSAIRFNSESNYMTSGGFGPNQVSAALGLGALAIFIYLLVEKRSWWLKALLFVLMVALAAQSALTFSRTGLYNAGISAIAATFYLARDGRTRLKILGVIVIGFLVANYLLLPKLDEFTSGALLTRFRNTNLTGRDTIIKADLQIWSDNPIFGVGPGNANTLRAESHRESSAHTEFSRLVAEHGVFGFLAFLLLIFMGFQNLRRESTLHNKAVMVALTCWSFGFMMVTAMRLVAPAALLGLGAVTLLLDHNQAPASNETDSRQQTFQRRQAPFQR
jgi:O-antigen ligase